MFWKHRRKRGQNFLELLDKRGGEMGLCAGHWRNCGNLTKVEEYRMGKDPEAWPHWWIRLDQRRQRDGRRGRMGLELVTYGWLWGCRCWAQGFGYHHASSRKPCRFFSRRVAWWIDMIGCVGAPVTSQWLEDTPPEGLNQLHFCVFPSTQQASTQTCGLNEKMDPWRRKWQPTPVFLPGEVHGQRSLVGCSPWGYMTEHVCMRVEGDGLVTIKW